MTRGALDLAFLASIPSAPVPLSKPRPAVPARGRGAEPSSTTAQPAEGIAAREGVPGEWEGRLEIGVMAIGGETTGIVLHTEQGSVELSIQQPLLRQTAQQYDGRIVHVVGTLTDRTGIEVKERRIVKATSIRLMRRPIAE